ncbi:HNH endonuclease [Aquiflexum sp. TKW24L]|uniref:HNH endonuclease n=1 Tax=Aquiflexum sp. TKW24L TaxID=2942212 RepID=UPI0020BFD996|nr:HNH endonuclease signature motif containing protein [Aquiflexum sp. TKW24L]MCL6258973.1 HNH endonuclease [Aquiflexum sp. TKW24L]
MMAKKKIENVRELIFYSYANLAMAHSAVERNQEKYGTFNYVIRAKLFKGLKDGTMNIRTIFDDEKIKIQTGKICNYCGSSDKLALDHIFPQKYGGLDAAENLIFACRTRNSSKGKKDLMEWMLFKGEFLPLMIVRRYLKLTFNYCKEYHLLDKKIDELELLELPFKIHLIPTSFPNPKSLILSISENIKK